MEITSKYDPIYANIYCVMASKRTATLSKNELKRDLANLYDARLSVVQSIDNNIITLRYTLTSILDQFLPTPASAEVDELFAQVLKPTDFDPAEIKSAASELSLYVSNYFDNKQNIASSRLNEMISDDHLTLTVEEIVEFYQNPDIEAIQAFIKSIYAVEPLALNFNDGPAKFVQEHSQLNHQLRAYKPADDVEIDLKLDQTYIAIAYQLPNDNVTLNNLVNLIFGGGVYSKLFKVVREELSLSYNIRSNLKSDDLITVSGGVNNQKLDIATAEIDQQLEVLKSGDFKEELKLAKTNYIENLKRSKTSEMAYISMYGSNFLKNTNRTHESIIEEIELITYEQVQTQIMQIKKLTSVYVK